MSKGHTLHELGKPRQREEAGRIATARDDQERDAFADGISAGGLRHLRRWCENLSTAAHDLKTPLTVLGGYIDILLEEKLGPLNNNQRDVLREMKQNEARLQRFIKDFLAFNGLRTSNLQLSLQTFRCSPLSRLPWSGSRG